MTQTADFPGAEAIPSPEDLLPRPDQKASLGVLYSSMTSMPEASPGTAERRERAESVDSNIFAQHDEPFLESTRRTFRGVRVSASSICAPESRQKI